MITKRKPRRRHKPVELVDVRIPAGTLAAVRCLVHVASAITEAYIVNDLDTEKPAAGEELVQTLRTAEHDLLIVLAGTPRDFAEELPRSARRGR